MTTDALVAAAVLAAGALYFSGALDLWRRSGLGKGLAGWQAGCFLGGLALVAAALSSPMETAAARLLWAHMAQHLLLALAAAPLLALGAPTLPMARGLARHWREPWRPSRRARRLAARPSWPLVAAGAHLAVLWAWHLPVLYEAALRSTFVHLLEHATMLGSALWLWSALVAGPLRRPRPTAALALFAVATLSVGLGALLAFSPDPWYAVYSGGGGLSAVEDQQVAGALMWALGGMVYTVAGAAMFAAWLRRQGGTAHA